MAKRVLIVDHDRALVQMLAQHCRSLGLEVTQATDGFDAVCSIFLSGDGDVPDLIILDVNLPYTNGLSICDKIAQENMVVPVIMLTGQSDPDTIRRCEEFGAYYIHKSQDTWADLEPLVRGLLELDSIDENRAARGTRNMPNEGCHRGTVLWIDDEPAFTKAFEVRLKQSGIEVIHALSGMQGFWKALKECPDVIISDYAMPEGYAHYLLRRLKDHTLTKHIPVIVVTGRDIAGRPTPAKDHSLERQLRNQGAECVLTKPLDHHLLLHELEKYLPSMEASSAVRELHG